MTVFVDADACPVTRDAIRVARDKGIPVVIVGNSSQNLARLERSGVVSVTVGTGPDAADFEIIERLSEGDTVVTQDIGLAAMVLGRGAHALSPRGRRFTRATIDIELAVRHAEARHRRQGGRTQGPSKFDEEDREHFIDVLDRILSER
jgi:uncharacterized protein YaiI (UPF0178 family)